MKLFSLFAKKPTTAAEAGTFLLTPEQAEAMKLKMAERAARREKVGEIVATTALVGFDAAKLALAGLTLAVAFTPIVAPPVVTLAVGGMLSEAGVGSSLSMIYLTLRGRQVTSAILAGRVILVGVAAKIGGRVATNLARTAIGVTLVCSAGAYAAAKELQEPTQVEGQGFMERVMNRLEQMSKDMDEMVTEVPVNGAVVETATA